MMGVMDDVGFVGISVSKRERKWGVEGNTMEMLQNLSLKLEHYVRG
jgi:hypothetical protein